ncbi:MAG: hypothetical protein ACOC8F_02995 [Planctomycetota bacterium]
MNAARREIWKLRAVKPYPEAHAHLLVGQVLERDLMGVRMLCRSFHHGRVVSSPRDVNVGELGTRVIPWARVEVVNVLPESFDFQHARVKLDKKGHVIYSDGHAACTLVTVGQQQAM